MLLCYGEFVFGVLLCSHFSGYITDNRRGNDYSPSHCRRSRQTCGKICRSSLLFCDGLELLVLLDGKMPYCSERFEDPYGLILYQFTMPGEYDHEVLSDSTHFTLGEAELSAAATLVKYWNIEVNSAVWITVCLVFAVGINLFSVGLSLASMNVNCTR